MATTVDEAQVDKLCTQMLGSKEEQAEAIAFIKALPEEEGNRVRWTVVKALEARKRSSKPKRRRPRTKDSSRVSRHSSSSSSSSAPGASAGSGGASGGGGASASGGSANSKDGNAGKKSSGSGVLGAASPGKRKMVGSYQLGETIGKGGFGTVYRGLDMRNGRIVAVKEVEKHLLAADQLPKIMKEAQLLEKLHHNNIVGFYDCIESSKQIHFVLEYIEGGSLYKVLKKYGNFPESLLVIYMVQVLRGLSYLHSQNVLHRDIKGANLLLTKDGTVKLADFGACTYAAMNKTLSVVGTPFWMAPEIIEMTHGGVQADIWSLGCTLIELLTGTPPYFELGTMQALYKMVDDDHPPIPDGVSEECHDFLVACFIKDPDKRPTAEQLLYHPWIETNYKGEGPISRETLTQTLRGRKKMQGGGGGGAAGSGAPARKLTPSQRLMESQIRILQKDCKALQSIRDEAESHVVQVRSVKEELLASIASLKERIAAAQ